MEIGDEVYIHGYIDEIRQDIIIIKNDGGYFGTVEDEIISYQKRAYDTKAKLSRKDDINMNGIERTISLDLDGTTVYFNMTQYAYENEYEFLDRAREYVSKYMVVDIA